MLLRALITGPLVLVGLHAAATPFVSAQETASVGAQGDGATGAAGAEEQRLDPDVVAAEARRLLRDPEATPEALGELADRAWALRLAAETIGLLDAALRRAPDDAANLERVRAIAPRLALDLPLPTAPEVWRLEDARLVVGIERTFATAGRWTSPVYREIAVLRLDDAAFPEAVLEAARAQLLARDAGRRAFAALVLRRLHPGEAIDPLIERSLLDVDDDVRHQASLSLAQLGDPAVAAPAVRALTAKRPILRVHAAQAVGWMGYAEAAAPLASALVNASAAAGDAPSGQRASVFFGTQTAYVQDFDVEVATGQSIADPNVAVQSAGAVLDVRLLGSSSGGANLRRSFERSAMSSLRRLTGEDAGTRVRDWRSWWEDSDLNPVNADREGVTDPAR